MAVQFHPLPPDVFPKEARPSISRLNRELADLFGLEGILRQPITSKRSDNTIVRRSEVQVDVSRVTPDMTHVVSGSSTVVGAPALTFGLTNTVGSTTTALSVNSAIALFGTQAPAALAATAAVGTSALAARADHVHIFPTTLRSTANASTAVLTDDGSNQTLAFSLGRSIIQSTGGFEFSATSGTVILDFDTSWAIGHATGIDASVVSAIGQTISGTKTTYNAAAGALRGVYVSATINAFRTSSFSFQPDAGSDTANKAYGMWLTSPQIRSTQGGWSELAGAFIEGPSRLSVSPSVALACGIITEPAAVGTTSQIGVYVRQRTAGQIAASRYGILIDSQNSGTNRWSIYGTSDRAQFTGPLVCDGAFGSTGAAAFGNTVTVTGNFRQNGSLIGFYNVGAGATQSTGWSVSNVTQTKTLNGSSFSLNDVMNVLGTLLTYVQVRGDISA